jgi:hypothetical protein
VESPDRRDRLGAAVELSGDRGELSLGGRRPINVDEYLKFPDNGPFPNGMHGVSCCSPNLPPGTPRFSGKRGR